MIVMKAKEARKIFAGAAAVTAIGSFQMFQNFNTQSDVTTESEQRDIV